MRGVSSPGSTVVKPGDPVSRCFNWDTALMRWPAFAEHDTEVIHLFSDGR
jgi:hypothetical protein